MVGRAAYQSPYLLAQIDSEVFGLNTPVPTRLEVVERMLDYIELQRQQDVYLSHITRHMLGLFQGCPGARAWRRHLSENGNKKGAGPEVVQQALALVEMHR